MSPSGESPQDFQAAVRSPEFQALAADAPPNNPALYEVARLLTYVRLPKGDKR